MKNKLCFFIAVIGCIFFCTSFGCSAVNVDDYDNLSDSLSDEFFSGIDEEIKDAFEKIGITDFDYSRIYNISLENFAEYFKSTLPQKFKGCLSDFYSLLGIVLIVSLVSTFFQNSEQGNFFKILSAAFISALTIIPFFVLNNPLDILVP